MNKFTFVSTLIAGSLVLSGCDNSSNDNASSDSQAVSQSETAQQAEATIQKQNSHAKANQSKGSDINIDYQAFTLENGLEVIFHIDRSDPVVAVALTAHVGSARELPGRTGFAHLFEHLLFLESENLGKGGLDKMSARIGGSGANGSTSRDRTNYFQTVPKNALEKMIWAEADKLGYFINTVTEQVLAKEKQVVKNEKRQGIDNRPYGHTQYVIDKNLYPKGHPYSWQVIGSLEDLQASTLKDVKDFFNRWYVPNNVSLVISGDFDTEQAKKWVHQYFDEIPRGQAVKANKKQPANLAESKRIVFEDNFARLPELTITWPTVPLYHKDSYALQVLRSLLSDGKKAEMNKLLIDELKLTNNVSMTSYDSELAGQTAIRVRAFENIDLNKVSQAIEQGFANFEKNGFNDDDLKRIKAEQETAFYQRLSSALGKGFQLAQYKIYTGDPGFINQDIKNILAVSKDDVMRVYKQYIKGKNYVATSFVPKGQKQLALKDSIDADIKEEQIVMGAEESFDASKSASYQKTPSSFDRSKEPPYDEVAMTIATPNVWSHQFDNQLEAFGIENNEVPLVNFSFNIAGGLLFDKPNKIGVANLTAELMNRGTKNKTPQQLEEAIQLLGASINIFATKQNITISGSTLAKNYEETMALVSEMILTPRWDEKEFELIKQSTLNRIKLQQAQPNTVAQIEFDKLIYGQDHILASNLIGTESSLLEITIEDLKNYYQNAISSSLTKLLVVGDISADKVNQSLTQLNKNWKAKKVTLPKVDQPKTPEKSAIYFYNIPKAKQSIVQIGYPALKATDKDYYPATVMNYRLGGGGFASQLTQELRENKGYTYGVRSSFIGNELTGLFALSTGVRANVTFESVALIKQIMSDYQASLTQRDLDITKGFFLKSNARRFETPQAKLNVLSNMSKLNLASDYIQQRVELVDSLSLDDMKALAGKYIQPNKMIYLVVGDAETQLSRLKELGLGEVILLNP